VFEQPWGGYGFFTQVISDRVSGGDVLRKVSSLIDWKRVGWKAGKVRSKLGRAGYGVDLMVRLGLHEDLLAGVNSQLQVHGLTMEPTPCSFESNCPEGSERSSGFHARQPLYTMVA
jgi:hypothetical protein